MSGNDDLLDTIEQIRQDKFSSLPAELVAEIVAIERDFVDNRTEAFKRIGQAIDKHLSHKAVSDNL